MTAAHAEYSPGDGPASKISVSLRAGNVRAIRERVGARGFSAYVDAAVERQIERDLLEEALLANEEHAGSATADFRDEAAAFFRELKADPDLRQEGT
ncbi:hypothetical protein [Nocardia carnea]|uniref:hypothetical protein n=1 Tax=Nocardia carnea TaxID=37328 RepID=UPI00245619ED|nr:hypothetical protein [Nocardia carnea]